MASRKQRLRMRQARLEFDEEVKRNRFIKETNEILGSMTKDELIEYAAKNDIEINKRAKKEEILNAIKDKVIT